MQRFAWVMAASAALMIAAACGGCEYEDEVDCASYVGLAYQEVMELEPRCGSQAWHEENRVRNPEEDRLLRQGLDYVGMRQTPAPEPTPEVKTAEFEEEYRTLRAREDDIVRCRASPKKERLGDRCSSHERFSFVLQRIEDLTTQYPDRAAALAPDIARLRMRVIAEYEVEFREVKFNLAVDYHAKLEVFGRCHQRCADLRDREWKNAEKAKRKPREIACACGESPTKPFFCAVQPGEVAAYAELLANVEPVGSKKLRTAQLAAARVYEHEEILHCEGEQDDDYVSAYTWYERAGDMAGMRRVAKEEARRLVFAMCHEATSWDDDHSVDASCAFDMTEIEAWDTKAGGVDAKARAKDLAGVSHNAESYGLYCEAIELAKRAGDTERVRTLTLAHGSQCTSWKPPMEYAGVRIEDNTPRDERR